MMLLRRVMAGWGRIKSSTGHGRLAGKRAGSRRLLVEPLESRALLTTLPVGFQETLVTKGVNPAGEDFAPDGRLFVANKQGTVSIVEADGTLASDPFFSVDVDTYRDRGLTAVLVDPDYVHNHYVYVYYTAAVPSNPDAADNGAVNKLVRLTASTANPDVADPTSAVTILDNIPSPTGIHQGGFLHFGADGMLYVGVGEGDVKANAQDLSNIYGKMLRLDVHNYPNIIPSDNPFVGQAGKDPEIWAYGFRNPFSGGIVPGTNTVFVNDVGNAAWEEVDQLVKGGNYGWPLAEGPSTDPNFINPLFAYPHNGAGAAIVGGAFYNGGSFPANYSGQYFNADLIQGVIRVVNPVTGQGTVWATGMSLPTDLDVGPDGSLYWTSIGQGAIYKISYIGGSNHAPTAVANADVTSGPGPLTVNFDGTASSDPDSDTLTYRWDFGDGTTGTGATVSHTYSTNGVYSAVLTVSDRPLGGLSSSSAPISIAVGDTLPVPTITLPTTGTSFRGGDTIQFSGAATDAEDGPLAASAFTWSVLLLDEGSVLPYLGPFQGVTSGSFQFPTTGIDADQSFRVSLTVTDSAGFNSTTFVDLHPVLSSITLATNIPGIPLQLDGEPVAAGAANDSVVGVTHTISAPLTQTVGAFLYRFVGWSDGGAASHDVLTTDAPTSYTAQYQLASLAATYSSNAPQHVIAGQTVTYQVTVTNSGTVTWPAGGTNRVQLGVYFGGASDDVGAWSKEPARFALTHDVAPGQSFTFNVRVTAPTTPGTYILRDRMVQEFVAWFDTMEKINVAVETLHASYSATPPTIWGAAQPQQYTVTVTNTGTATWHADGPDRVRLGVYFGSNNTPTWSTPVDYFTLPQDVAPGQSATLTIDVAAPSKPGTYGLRERLIQDNVGWFPELLRTTASVERLSARYIVNSPTQWQAGQTRTYSITLINTGTKTWKANGANPVHLGVYFAGASDAVGDWSEEPARYVLPHDVAPGSRVTLKITVTAPLTPGTYVLRHRMVKEFVNWFNQMVRTNVTVQ